MFDRIIQDKIDAMNALVEEALKDKLADVLDKLDANKVMAHEARLKDKLGGARSSQLGTRACASYDERTGEIVVDLVLPSMPKQENPLYPVGFPVECPAIGIRPIKGLVGPRGPSCAPGMPALLRSTLSKPLMYSVDVYRAVSHEGGYVAVSSFPITATLNMTETKMKPCAFGTTPKEAEDKLAEAIKSLTGRREIGVINTHYMTDRWLCVKCINSLGYPTKAELVEHIALQHTDSGSLAT